MSRNLFVAMCKRGRQVEVYDAAVAHHLPSQTPDFFKQIVRTLVDSSLLTHGFNKAWSGCLTLRKKFGLTHFAMIHSDIAAKPGWADVLVQEMEANDADLISAVVPIKDDRGLTSTALDTGDEYSPTRLTMKEIFDRPETFTEPNLLVNTGLWVIRLDRPWAEHLLFRQQDQILKLPDGRFLARTNPEDWDFSRQVRRFGGKIFATRKTPLYHERPEFHNESAWGTWKTEQGDRPTELLLPAEKSEKTEPEPAPAG